ncbi:MAG: hypothetical protein M3N39_13845 [Pseudomonadota bacterium]|nr:hypothetical protein [Pseudomonadota bacterium]
MTRLLMMEQLRQIPPIYVLSAAFAFKEMVELVTQVGSRYPFTDRAALRTAQPRP